MKRRGGVLRSAAAITKTITGKFRPHDVKRPERAVTKTTIKHKLKRVLDQLGSRYWRSKWAPLFEFKCMRVSLFAVRLWRTATTWIKTSCGCSDVHWYFFFKFFLILYLLSVAIVRPPLVAFLKILQLYALFYFKYGRNEEELLF